MATHTVQLWRCALQNCDAAVWSLQVEAQQLVVPNAFGSMLQEAGAVGLNAATSHDNTR